MPQKLNACDGQCVGCLGKMKSKQNEKPVAAERRLQGTRCKLHPTAAAGRASDNSREVCPSLGTPPAPLGAVSAVLQLWVGMAVGWAAALTWAGNLSWGKAQHPPQRAAGLGQRWACP